MTRSKTKKGDAPAKAKAKMPSSPAAKKTHSKQAASTKKPRGGEMAALVEKLVLAQLARAEADDEDAETSKRLRPKHRKPATPTQIADLERAWGRPLPPTYRAFLEVCNGIDDELGTHRLLGTDDQKWAQKQVAQLSEFWEDFDATTVIPVAVPQAGIGIQDFAAFVRGDGAEMPIADWDRRSAFQRHKTFAAYLEHLVALEHRVAKANAKEKKAAKAKEVELDRGRATLIASRSIPRSGAARKAAFEAVFTLEDTGQIRAVVEKLARAKPSADELETYLDALDYDLQSGHAAAFARAELVFHPTLSVPKALRASWLVTVNDAIARMFATNDRKRSERWSDVARPYVRENAYLGHNLACAFVAVGRIDDAFEMCKAAVASDYPALAKMRTDADLGPLIGQERFQKLFGPGDRTDQKARTSIPRNAALEAEVAAGKSVAKYGAWLTKQGSSLGAVVQADLAASQRPNAEKEALTRFARYKNDVFARAFPLLAGHITHFLVKEYYFSFRYGFLEKLDTFRLDTPKEREEALALVADPHAMFVRHVALRKAKLDSLELFSRLPALRRIQCRWTDITQVDSLEPLAGLLHLRALNVNNSKIGDLRPVAKLPLLQLYCDKTEVVDLSPLAEHPMLSHITLRGTRVRDLSPLLTCPRLCCVDLWDVKIDKPELEELAQHIEKTKNRPVNDEALLDGYVRGISHADT